VKPNYVNKSIIYKNPKFKNVNSPINELPAKMKTSQSGNLPLRSHTNSLSPRLNANVRKTRIQDDIKKQKYDFHQEYLNENGLGNKIGSLDNTVTYRINIDSSNRKKKTEYKYGQSITLDNNPFDLKKNSNSVFIYYYDALNKFSKDDKIIIYDIVPLRKTLRSTNNNNIPSFDIQVTCNFMKIFVDHDIPLDYVGDNITISIADILGDNGPSSSSTFLGNIPVSLINQSFPIKLSISSSDLIPGNNFSTFLLSNPTYTDPSSSYLFVILPIALTQTYTLSNYNFNVTFQSIGGIPISRLNNSEKYPYHKIVAVQDSGIVIELDAQALIDERGGGIGIKIKKIEGTLQGYPNNNSYSIYLEPTYTNIISARLLNLIFPNTQPAIIDGVNNKLYWQSINDNNYVYSLSIPQGNYTIDQLKSVIESIASKTTRINVSSQYSKYHYFTIDINQNTNLVTINTYKKFEVEQAITSVSPTINTNPNLDSHPPGTTFLIQYTVPSHGLTSVGTKVTFSGLIEHLGINAVVLNSIYEVESIIDSDNFTIRLPKINLLTTRTNSKGGRAITIYIPEMTKFRFDYNDTIGSVLGFRASGNNNSITPFAISHTNNDAYIDDTETGFNSIKLSGEDYVLMSINQLNKLNGNGVIKKFFAKINLCDLPGTELYNSFTESHIEFPEIIDKLTQLDISFSNKDGSLFDFNGVEHSFMLEFKSVISKMDGSNIHAKSGKIFEQKK
jgi:hypothetical protein